MSIKFDVVKDYPSPSTKLLCYDMFDLNSREVLQMLVYQISLQLALENAPIEITVMHNKVRHPRMKGKEEPPKVDWKSFNQQMSRDFFSSSLAFFAYQETGETTHLVAISHQYLTQDLAEDEIKYSLHKTGNCISSCQVIEIRETTMSDCCNVLLQGEDNDMLRGGFRFYSDIGLSTVKDQLDLTRRKDGWRMEEHISTTIWQKKNEAMLHIRQIMGHRSLKEEMIRIYHSGNHKTFLEHPVHYSIHASSRPAAQEMIDALVGGLYANGRILSKRINYFCDFDGASGNERSIRTLLDSAKYTAVAAELPGSVARTVRPLRLGASEMDISRFWLEETVKHHRYTLFIFVQISEEECDWEKNFERDLANIVDVVPLYEGSGDETATRNYLNNLSTLKGLPSFEDDDLREVVPKGIYTPTHAIEIFDRLCKMRLHRDFYPAYQNIHTRSAGLGKLSCKNANPTLQLSQMVGLREIKSLVERIVAAHKMKKIRRGLNLKENRGALHMVFTGNPGSAKTTAARLLTGIMKEEQVLSTGTFIECGRSDLVGKYVGWTAKIVAQKFQEASGGVLFIDEAYALVDRSNSFGTEAINTIVQEMENHRDDVVVIFAGYPGKMQELIESNEGLKSRIAFYVNFPDYNTEELVKILCLMAKERGLRLNPGILRKCRCFFQEVVKEDNFGNGRYVRNLLEAAMMRQAERLIAMSKKHEITRQKAVCLTMEDFMPIKLSQVKPKSQMGFQMRLASDTV